MHFSNGNYETMSSKLADENAKCWVELERSYSYLRLAAACSKIAQTSIKVRETKLLPLVLLRPQRRISRASFELTTGRFTSLRWPENERHNTVWKCCFEKLSIFYKNKASHHKLKHNFRLRNKCNVFYQSIGYRLKISALDTALDSIAFVWIKGDVWFGSNLPNSEAKIWKPAHCHQPVLCSLIKYAVPANQSARYMET